MNKESTLGKLIQQGMTYKPSFNQAFIPLAVSCANCSRTFQVDGIAVVNTLADVWKVAETLHMQGIKQTGVICANPSLSMMYNNVLMQNEVKK